MNYNSDYYTGAYLVLEGNWAPTATTGMYPAAAAVPKDATKTASGLASKVLKPGTGMYPAPAADPINSALAPTVKVLAMGDGPLGELVIEVPAPMPSMNFEVETMMGGTTSTDDGNVDDDQPDSPQSDTMY